MNKRIYIGVGHGGQDSGAISNNGKYFEKDLNLKIATKVEERLKDYAVTTRISRETDVFQSLSSKISDERVFNSDLAFDIHCNSCGVPNTAAGFEIFRKNKDIQHTFAKVLEREMQGLIGSRGIKTQLNNDGYTDYFGFVREPLNDAYLIEVGFINNDFDLKMMLDEEFTNLVADSIVRASVAHLDLEYKVEKNKFELVEEIERKIQVLKDLMRC